MSARAWTTGSLMYRLSSRMRCCSRSVRRTPAREISPTFGSRSAGPPGPATTVNVSDSAESPSTRSRTRSPAWNAVSGVCASADAAFASSATAIVMDHSTRLMVVSLDHLRARLALALVDRFVARQVVGVVGVIAIHGAAGHVVQHGAEQPDRQPVQDLELRSRDAAMTVSGPQHDQQRARHRPDDERIDARRQRRAVDDDDVEL